MQLDGEDIPLSVIQTWMVDIERLAPQEVRLLAANRPSVTQGFRPGSVDVQIARERLKSALARSAEIPVDIRAKLRSSGLATSLLVVLSEEALERIAVPLAGYFGVEALVAALLLDERRAVRDLARLLLARREAIDRATTKEEYVLQLHAELGAFLGHIRELLDHQITPVGNLHGIAVLPAHVQGSNTAGATHVSSRAPRPKREADLVVALRSKRREVSRLNRENSQLSSQVNAATVAWAAIQASLTATCAQLRETQSEFVDLQSQFNSRVEGALRDRLDRKLLPWLAPAEALSQTAHALGISVQLSDGNPPEPADPVEPEIIQMARRLLVRQADSDRRFGLRSALFVERDRCIAFRERLREAQIDSVRPLAELTEGVQALDTRIRQIEMALGANAADVARNSPGLVKLKLAFAEADSLDKLSVLRRRLIASEPLGLLSQDELDHAYVLLDQASSEAYAIAGVGCGWTVDRGDLRGLPLYAMQAALSRGEACTLVVDGHNVLWKVPKLFRALYERDQPGAQARQALETVLFELAERYPSLTIQLWFDSNVLEDRSLGANMRVHFSGGEGDNRADRQMLAYLAYMNVSATNEVRTVVTADSEVAVSAQASGALVMTPQELAVWVA